MNQFYIMALGSYLMSATAYHKDSHISSILWLVIAIANAFTGRYVV